MELFVILDYFLPFYPPNNPKNQNFDIMKKTTRDIIILHMCIINENDMMGIWSMTDRIFSQSRPFFALLPPENENFKKMKKTSGNIIILHKCTIN